MTRRKDESTTTLQLRRIAVVTASRTYTVVIGANAIRELPSFLAGSERAAIVTQESIPVALDSMLEQRTFTIPEGENAKNFATLEILCRAFARWQLRSTDVVISVGGGIVSDVAGFAAAIYHRGIRVIHVPTTLLAQVDASVGGKTGINLPEGKNLVGAIWQPCAVLCDTAVLATLPERERRAALGEVIRLELLYGEELFALGLEAQIARCVELKAAAVRRDEGRGDERDLLNYGHTLAHALETVGGHDLRHGEVVAVGLVFAARLAHALGRIPRERVQDHCARVRRARLPTRLPPDAPIERLLSVMARDKKSGGGLWFVLDGPYGFDRCGPVAPATVRATLRSMAARSAAAMMDP